MQAALEHALNSKGSMKHVTHPRASRGSVVMTTVLVTIALFRLREMRGEESNHQSKAPESIYLIPRADQIQSKQPRKGRRAGRGTREGTGRVPVGESQSDRASY